MEALNELKNELEDLEQQAREILGDTLKHRGISVDEAIKLYQAVNQLQKLAGDIEIPYTE